jgi:hypothetical protein
MRYQVIAIFLIASICGAQTPIAVQPGLANTAPQTPAPPAAPSNLITVLPGTTIQLTLLSTIRSKSTKPGDSVRAVVAFPVTVGTQLAIPAGTYVEGTVNAVTARAPHTRLPSVQIHFTRLLFASGYEVTLDATNTEAMVILPDADFRATYEIADARDGAPVMGEGFSPLLQTSQQPSMPGPNPAVVVGATTGGFVAIVAILFALAHHNAKNTDYLLFDNGWQFAMVLQSEITLDANKVAASAAIPRG